MTSKIFTYDPFSVLAPSTDRSTGSPSAPTGTLAAWAVLQERVVPATAIGVSGTTITAVFQDGLPVNGSWTCYISEAIGGGRPGVIAEQVAAITKVTRP